VTVKVPQRRPDLAPTVNRSRELRRGAPALVC
jgi:hypothetical protein